MNSKFLTKTMVGGKLVLALGNGKTLTVEPSMYPQEIRDGLEFHGLSQKLGDSTAGYSKTGDYSGAYAEMVAVHEAMVAGQWRREGVGGGINLDDLAEAIAKLKKVDLAKASKVVEDASPEKRREWVSNVKVAALMAEMRAKRLKEKAKEEDADIEVEFE